MKMIISIILVAFVWLAPAFAMETKAKILAAVKEPAPNKENKKTFFGLFIGCMAKDPDALKPGGAGASRKSSKKPKEQYPTFIEYLKQQDEQTATLKNPDKKSDKYPNSDNYLSS